jgi:hypothetical protein
MGLTYRVDTAVDLDPWAVEGFRWAYEHLGMTSQVYSDTEMLGAVVHDILHAMADEVKLIFLDHLSFSLAGGPIEQLTAAQLEAADTLEAAWFKAGAAARLEFFRRMNAARLGLTSQWIINVHAPSQPEVLVP